MLGHAMAYADSTRCCERPSPCEPISWTSGVGGTRSAAGHAAGAEAVAHRDERIARGGRTAPCNEAGSAGHRGIPHRLRQPAHGEPRPLATRSGTPARADRASAALVAVLAGLCRRVQGVAKAGRPRVALGLSRSRTGRREGIALGLTLPTTF